MIVCEPALTRLPKAMQRIPQGPFANSPYLGC
jgi:hypothetical protein